MDDRHGVHGANGRQRDLGHHGREDNLVVAPLAPNGVYAGFSGDAKKWLENNLP